jgi:8-oxo-dGTP pyrophosphatase MutT (NUDIX family)
VLSLPLVSVPHPDLVFDVPLRFASVACLTPSLDALLLVHAKRSGAWELPGGKIDVGDACAWSAAVRELDEEAGLSHALFDWRCKFACPPHRTMGIFVGVKCTPSLARESCPHGETDGGWWFPLEGLPTLSYPEDDAVYRGIALYMQQQRQQQQQQQQPLPPSGESTVAD